MSELSQRLANLSPAKRRLLEQRLQQKNDVAEPIAIVGMGCRLPGAENIETYWQVIAEGIDCISEVPPDRWDVDELYDPSPDTPGKMNTRWGGFLGNPRLFDPLFFGITPREASKMDPQQRVVLEVAWEAMERGGLSPERLAGTNTGVFIGIGGTDYSKAPAHLDNYLEHIDAYGGTGNALSIAANRLSYLLDLHGPSLAVDTACSSALVCVHLAVSSLRSHECDAALAGGVNMILTPETSIAFSTAHMLSPDGKCRPFDASANGYVRGEGCGIVVLKRLTDAVAAGDHVFAVIRGTAVNQDGRTSGITAPNGLLQQAVVRAALANAGLGPERVSYIEAHGTGTPLGDPIEVQALAKVFRQNAPTDPPVYLSSVKANIGHLETASGIAGLIKVVLLMQYGRIPPQLHLDKINPNISLSGTRLQIPARSVAWKSAGSARVACVSSFGFGGTNAHVVLEESLQAAPAAIKSDRPLHLLPLSAKTETALAALAGRYADYLDAHSEAALPDICHTAAAGRSHFNRRLIAVAATRDQLREQLVAVRDGQTADGVKKGLVKIVTRPKIAFLFTGQGSQYAGMGRQLFDTHPVFRETLEQCDAILREHLEQPLLSVLFPESGQSPLDETAYTQPALFALEYSLATLWRSWGIEPDALLGHSVGEYVAACIAGVFGLEDGLRLIAHRSRLMQALPHNGLMAVIFAAENRVANAIRSHEECVAIAAANGPENTVISGEAAAVRRLVDEFEAAGVGTRLLTVSHAFHSPLMEPMLDEFERLAGETRFERPRIPIASNLTGQVMPDEPPAPRYWRQHIRNTVRFADGMRTLAALSPHVMLEVGPTTSLLGMGRRVLTDFAGAWLASLRSGHDDWQAMLNSLGELYLLGAKVDWPAFDRPWPRRRLSLPTYPFERVPLWFDDGRPGRRRTFGTSAGSHGASVHPLLGGPVPTALGTTLFESRFSSHTPRYLIDHQVQGSPVTPAAAYLELALAAARQSFGEGEHVVENIAVQQAMFFPQGAQRIVQTTLSPETGGQRTFEVHSALDQNADGKYHWTMHACGTIRCAGSTDAAPADNRVDLVAIRERLSDSRTRQAFYSEMAARGLNYGPAFQVLDSLRRGEGEAFAEVRLSDDVARESSRYRLHPALLDGCFQSMAGVVPLESDGNASPYTYMPVYVRRIRVYDRPAELMYCHAIRTSELTGPSPEAVEGDVQLLDQKGRILVELAGIRVQRLGRAAVQAREVDVRDWLYRVDWQPQPLGAGASITGSAASPWVILADQSGIGSQLAACLRQQGQECVIVSPGEGPAASDSEEHSTVDPLRGDAYRELFERLLSAGLTPSGIIHLWNLDIGEPTAGFDSDQFRRLGCAGALQLIQQLARTRFTRPPQLWFVTRGAQPVTDAEATAFAQSPLWGFGRVVALEHPEMRCRLVDLDPSVKADDAARTLFEEIAKAGDEDQIAFRGGQRFVARLVPAPELAPKEDLPSSGLPAAGSGAYRLRLRTSGSFDSLWYEPTGRRQPEPGQVEIEVRAAGLNFSDVLKAMGLYPGIRDEIVPLGIECSGTITAIGEGVTRFQVGDEVMGVAPYSFASHAVTAEYAVVHRPARLADDEACTIPITFLTAYYGLVHLAHLAPGERVLIHAGAGGVGLAAIQIAQQIGAEVFCTVGSDTKREYLRSLGVEHVFSSRSLDFAEEILRDTNREGVDVVLNSLPGDAITRSLSILRAYGRFLEIGKTDIYQNRMIGLLPFQDNLSYFAIDLDRMLRQRPDYIRRLFAEVMTHFESGTYQPLALTLFPAADTVGAFRYMAQRKNIGKVVVSFEQSIADDRRPADTRPVRPNGTYLITGGLGALGLCVARWLAEQGAGHLVLLGRSAPQGDAATAIEELRRTGAAVAAVRGDVADPASLRHALDQIPQGFPPLRGVIHAAGVLADGLLFEMNLERFERPLMPKIAGAWNLHAATAGAPLEFFILFSSVASVLGSPGQGNYAAGNAFLDSFAHWRRAQGLPATSINWGPWAGAGMAADIGGDQMAAKGMGLIPRAKGLEALAAMLRTQIANVAVVDARWPEMERALRGRRPAILERVLGNASEDAPMPAAPQVDESFRQELMAIDKRKRVDRLRDYFARELARIMAVDPASLDLTQPLTMLGLDSLMAIELKNNLEGRLAISLPMARFLEGPSVTSLAEAAAPLFGDGSEAASNPAGDATVPPALAGSRNGASAEWTPIVTLAREGNQPPLYCVHPVGGDIRCYLDLARALGDRPVHALRARGIEPDQVPHEAMADLADEYIAAIRRLQPEGVYHLAGWSTGGIYAYEMARRLQADGQACKLVFFDSPRPAIFKNVDLEDDARFLYDLVNFSNYFAGTHMRVSYHDLLELNPDERLQAVLAEAKEHSVMSAEVAVDHLRRLIDVCRANVRAIMDYSLVGFKQTVYFFRPAETSVLAEAAGQDLDADLGWGTVPGLELLHEVVPGDHFSMMTGENARQLAERLVRCLQTNRMQPSTGR